MVPLPGFLRCQRPSQTPPQSSSRGHHMVGTAVGQLEQRQRYGVEIENPRGTGHAKCSTAPRYVRGRGLCLVAACSGRPILLAGSNLGLSRQLPVHDLRAMLALGVGDRFILRDKSAICLCARGISLPPALPALLSRGFVGRTQLHPAPGGGRIFLQLQGRAIAYGKNELLVVRAGRDHAVCMTSFSNMQLQAG
jgi:hypothetical protein